MTELTQAVADLQTAVQGVSDRVGPTVDALKAAVAAGEQALADANSADLAEDADFQAQIDALKAALEAVNAASAEAAATIEANVSTLNTIAAAPAPEPEA